MMTNVTTATNPVMTSATNSVQNTPAASWYAYSRIQEFEKGGQQSSSNYTKFQNCEQWSKWHCTLMGKMYKHKYKQVLDSTYVSNLNDFDEVELFKA